MGFGDHAYEIWISCASFYGQNVIKPRAVPWSSQTHHLGN